MNMEHEPGEENLRGCQGIMYGCGLSAIVFSILGGLIALSYAVGLL